MTFTREQKIALFAFGAGALGGYLWARSRVNVSLGAVADFSRELGAARELVQQWAPVARGAFR
jgi:hypothetical protein